jgi:hypothetical protein
MPHNLQLFKDNVSLDAASSLVFTALAAKASAQPAAPAQAWLVPLQQLAQSARVERGTAAELGAYQGLVRRQIEGALAGVAGEQPLGLSEQLQKALRFVNEGKTSYGHELAVELLGFAGLAGLAAMSGRSRKLAAWEAHGARQAPQNCFSVALMSVQTGLRPFELSLHAGPPVSVALLESLPPQADYACPRHSLYGLIRIT